MLLFLDEPRHIKIVRHSPDGGARDPLGRIKKGAVTVPDDIGPQLRADETDEVAAMFDLLTAGEACRIKAQVAAFPATVREVLAYYQDSATPAERNWILGALLEGLRIVRRHERQAAA